MAKQQAERSGKDWLSLGTTKTGLVYRLKEIRRRRMNNPSGFPAP